MRLHAMHIFANFLKAGSFFTLGCAICCLLLFLNNCSTVNLNTEKRRQEFKPLAGELSIQQLRQEVFGNIDPSQLYKQGRTMCVTASDIWESTFIRWLAPLDENMQKFKAQLKLYHKGIEYTFLNRDHKMVQGILMPFWIGIADDLLQPKFDHYLVLETITFGVGD
jgi:hypothetical protein